MDINYKKVLIVTGTMTIRLLALFILFVQSIYGQKPASFPAIIPLPADVKQTQETFHLHPPTVIVCKDDSLFKISQLLNLYLEANGVNPLQVTHKEVDKNFIALKIDSAEVTKKEGYILKVGNSSIEITGHDEGGVIYGLQTLRQLWQTAKNKSVTVPGCIVSDYPRFGYRGMSLDVGRHMFPVSFIKRYIDLLSLYKFNTFHWHLTEDQGWRIEIKRYPELQSVAAWRDETLIGHKKELPHRFDGKKYGGFYTQSSIRDIVQYAAQRNITIVPEIEMPGHALAALSAYPSLGCTGGPYKAATFWGIFDDVYCGGNDSTFVFLQNVLDEVMELFPSKYIHIGGDECPKDKWKRCPKCQERIRSLGLTDEHGLQSYFIQRIEKYVNSKGRNIIGWDEILEGGLAPNATVMSWRGEEGGIAAAQQHHNVILTPESHLYFDYYQSLYEEEPLAGGGYTPLSKVYGYEPAGQNMNDSIRQYFKGIEAQAWSEYFTDTAKAEYMIFPRALAIAELAWTSSSRRNYPDFLTRLRMQKNLLTRLKVHAADNFDEVQSGSIAATPGGVRVILQSSLPDATIHYTTNGDLPSLKSNIYKDSLVLRNSCTLRARLFDKTRRPTGRVFRQKISVHKATGRAVWLKNKPVARFNTDPGALVNGMDGNSRYNNGQWVGFGGDDFEAVIDLGAIQTLHSVGMHFLNYHWQRMWAPELLELYVSQDLVNYTKVFTRKQFTVNGINDVIAVLQSVRAKYIKIIARNKGIIPEGEYGAGNKALLMVDEIAVN